MSKKHHGGPGPVPAGNRPQSGADFTPENDEEMTGGQEGGERSEQEQDTKQRLGDFTGTGEHSIQEPGGKNGSNRK